MTTLSAKRIRPGVYEVIGGQGVIAAVAKVGSKWVVSDRHNVYTRDGFDTKRACLEHIEAVDQAHEQELARKAAKRRELLERLGQVHVWIDVGRVGPVELAEIISAILPGVHSAAWIASAMGPQGHAVLITWRGEEGELDEKMLGEHGGRVVGSGMSVPDGYREVA